MKRIILAIVAILVILGFVVASHLSGTVKGIIESAGTQALGTKVTVSGLDVSLVNATASLSGLSVANPPGFRDDFLKAKSISATLGGVADKTVTIKEIVVDGMTITYALGPNGTNFDVLRKNLKSAPSGSGPVSGAPSSGEPSSENTAANDGAKNGGYDVIIKQLRIIHAQVIPDIKGFNKPVNLPEIVVTNIGSKDNPATPTQVARQIMDHVLAISSGAASATLKNGLSSLPTGAAADKAKSALQGLFSK